MEIITLAATPAAVVALVNLAKELGAPPKLALVLAVTLGVVLSLADYYLGANGAYHAAIQGLMLGLAAGGLYDLAKTAGPIRNVKNS